MAVIHFADARSVDREVGHIRGRWTFLGEAAGTVNVGMRRIQVAAGGWSTPAHEHGREEEIFFVLAGRGVLWQDGDTAEVGEGDCIVHLPGTGAHTLHALEDLDVLAFGTRESDETPWFPRLSMSLVGGGMVETSPGAIDHAPAQFVHEAKLGPPELPPQFGARPANITNVGDVETRQFGRGRVEALRRNLGVAAGSKRIGLQHATVAAGKESAPPHCHSVEEEVFVVLGGDGVVALDGEETPVRWGSVISRPPATGVSHQFRAGENGLVYLAFGTRDPADMCYYPRSMKISFRGLGVVARVERLDYWDGEE